MRDRNREWVLPPADFGRVLTLPEINDIRRGHDPVDENTGNPWNASYLTSSLEYYGMSAGGVDLVCVRHGDGPSQADLDHDPLAFRRLLDGAYGDVHVVARREIDRWRKSGWQRPRRRFVNPLMEARFGGTGTAQAFNKQNEFEFSRGRSAAAIRVNFPDIFDETYYGVNGRMARLGVFQVERASDGGYCFTTAAESGPRPYLSNLCFVAVNATGSVRDIAPPVRLQTLVRDAESTAWIADGTQSEGPRRLMEVHGVLMTETESQGGGRDWPRHRVRSFEEIGLPIEYTSAPDLEARIIEGGTRANAYLLHQDPKGRVTAQLVCADIDSSVRVPTTHELLYDWATKRELARIEGNRWWRERRGAGKRIDLEDIVTPAGTGDPKR